MLSNVFARGISDSTYIRFVQQPRISIPFSTTTCNRHNTTNLADFDKEVSITAKFIPSRRINSTAMKRTLSNNPPAKRETLFNDDTDYKKPSGTQPENIDSIP